MTQNLEDFPGHSGTTAPAHDAGREEDRSIFEALSRREQSALAALYDKYGRIVFSLASKILPDPRESEEVTQDVFLSLWRSPDSFDAKRASALTWLACVTRNKCIDRLRKAGRRIPSPVADPGDEPSVADPSQNSNPFAVASLKELSQQIQACLTALSGVQRSAVELAYFECLTHSEIAARLAESAGTVKSRLRLAMNKLRSCMTGKQFEV